MKNGKKQNMFFQKRMQNANKRYEKLKKMKPTLRLQFLGNDMDQKLLLLVILGYIIED